jgi:hypothetical protein
LFLNRLIDQRVRVLRDFCSCSAPLKSRSLQQETDLTARPPGSIAALERYGEATAATLLYLQLQCLAVADVQADHAASHIGAGAREGNPRR